ncbi:Bug family tripartite tricarboxylate transporter substrate binding protein, partial [Klebsiella pneumoniae]|uniref:Bug family tripartite tricarboxylate transporter substrate binding protein n=1 Tax=Klebsiella pneumoniae TaxID=573 RepID=UPI003A8B5F76
MKLVVPFPPGGPLDVVGRTIAQKLSETWGQSVVVDNKPGAGGNIGADIVAKSPADGYTILVGASGAMAVGPLIYKTDYDTLKSFTPVTMIGDFPLFLAVAADHPAKNAKELVAWTNANPEKANYATSSP